jgi:hypothetical protein
MIRTILKSNKNNLIIQLPDNLVGKLIEVIAFEIKEENVIAPTKTEKLKPSQLRGFLSDKGADALHSTLKKAARNGIPNR